MKPILSEDSNQKKERLSKLIRIKGYNCVVNKNNTDYYNQLYNVMSKYKHLNKKHKKFIFKILEHKLNEGEL